MPFSESPTRNAEQLTSFFENNIKKPIEFSTLAYKYKVSRSADKLLITEHIIRSLHKADIVICDLSGKRGNSNVMYELGVRLALSNRPVILIREGHPANEQIFDIGAFYAELYDPLNYRKLETFLLKKLSDLEVDDKEFESPVLKIIEHGTSKLTKLTSSQRYTLFSWVLESLWKRSNEVAKIISKFLSDSGVQNVPDADDSHGLAGYLEKNETQIADLNWSTIDYDCWPSSAIEFYADLRYLRGAIPDGVEDKFATLAQHYHAIFVEHSRPARAVGAGYCRLLMTETLILLHLAISIRFIIRPDAVPAVDEESLSNFATMYSRSKITDL